MPRKPLLVMLTAALLASAAAGGTVYLRDGRKLVGKVTREGGKVKVEMALGTVVVDESEVIYASEAGPRTRPTAAPPPPEAPAEGGPAVQPTAEWDIDLVTLPEPALFMTARKLELLAGMAETESIRHELEQWRIFVHDGRRKVGTLWLTRDQQRQRRDRFLEHAREGLDLTRKARYIYGRTAAQETRKKRLYAQAEQTLAKGAQAWPDLLVRDFLLAVLDLRAERYAQAERRFRTCIEREPLIAAFHQGRGLALLRRKQHLRALGEFIVCLQLRDDTYETIKLVQTAMKEVPGGYIKEPLYLKAKELVERYAKPKYPHRGYRKGVPWLMPGKEWQSRGQELFTPPYDRIVAKQALAVPISKGGGLLVDREAIAGAELLYVQIARGQLVRAEPTQRAMYGSTSSKPDLPLTTIRVSGVTLAPVDLAKPAPVKAGQTVTLHAANLYRQMGTQIRTGEAKVLSAGADGVKLDAGLLPGEPTGVVLAGEAFAGLLTGRCDPEEKNFGKSTFIKPADLAAWAKKVSRSLRYRSSYSRGPALKKDAPVRPAAGQVFLVHVLAPEKPPTKLGK